ncbi:MAG TPA: hypothetical protein VIL46_00450 [Gemmataceae bacterium]
MRTFRGGRCGVWPAVAVLACAAAAGAQDGALPQGPGLAAKYPGDAGIAQDERVLLAEDFEQGGVADLAKRWESVSDEGGKVLALSDDVPPPSAGKKSLRMTATLGENTGGHLYRRLPREVEKVFARFYVKFPEGGGYIHHFVHLGGYRPATAWPQGGAGSRPRGDERFTVGIEPYGERGRFRPPGTWVFYPYWAEMKVSAGGRYWGNAIRPAEPKQIVAGKWQCVEIMLKLNAPDRRDGELALWLDGKLEAHVAPGVPRGEWTGMGFHLLKEGGEPFEGFRWRTDERLKVNFFWLLHYVTENAARQNRVREPVKENAVWFDDIVVATEYVGPTRPRDGSR